MDLRFRPTRHPPCTHVPSKAMSDRFVGSVPCHEKCSSWSLAPEQQGNHDARQGNKMKARCHASHSSSSPLRRLPLDCTVGKSLCDREPRTARRHQCGSPSIGKHAGDHGKTVSHRGILRRHCSCLMSRQAVRVHARRADGRARPWQERGLVDLFRQVLDRHDEVHPLEDA